MRYLLSGGSGSLIALAGGRVAPMTLEELIDPATGRIRVRLVDTSAQAYEVARRYMVRLEASDLAEPRISQLSGVTSLAPAAFSAQFSRLTKLPG